eukprot:TRINITY_DN68614_c0_g1_i1.p1 TRINITY_DN68614_c0_g1~~TRINITY_DN68614_c0_g1_i1.p1  ORF type:complete len:508 (+),score=60.85 TRINITY_DN68614_c0_g1_i1:150-1526(+)
MAAPSDPAVLDVARAIYLGGRSGGLPGIEAVAHVIQNRMGHPQFPRDPQAVVTSGSEQFAPTPRASSAAKEPQAPAERLLFEQARRFAAQLVHPPKRLTSSDPTGGAIYYDERAPQRLHSTSRPFDAPGGAGEGSSRPSTTGGAVAGPRLPVQPLPQEPGVSATAEAPDPSHVEAEGSGTSSPPAPMPPTDRRPLSFLRDRRVAGLPPPRRRPSADRGSEATASRSTTAPGSAYLPPQPPPSSSAMTLGQTSSVASTGSASAGGSTASGLGVGSASSAGGGPSATAAPRLLARSAVGARGSEGMSRSLAPSRNTVGVQLGPRDNTGYHDVLLPCGLLQDEVIELMYRDLNPEDFDVLTKLDERLAPRNTAQRNFVERLPRVPVRNCGSTECGVCLADFDSNGHALQLPCMHSFHHACISKWLTQCKNTCPLCSAPIGQPGQTVQLGQRSAAVAPPTPV